MIYSNNERQKEILRWPSIFNRTGRKSFNRGDEIDAWLEECGTNVQYVIIDDLRAKYFKEHQLPRLLIVDPIGGLDEDTAERAIELLNSDIK